MRHDPARLSFESGDSDGAARTGVIQTSHGPVTTPAFVPLATSGTVRGLSSAEVAGLGYGMVLVGMVGSALEPVEDLGLGGTVFNEATLTYIAYGTMLGILGGVVHWAPKLWGREVDTKKVAPLALLGVLGVVLACFPLYIAGFLDQPGGLAYDDSDLQIWNILALVGQGLVALAVLGFVSLLIGTALGSGDDAVDDPFDGQTIEWATTSPAPADNFVDVPMVTSAEPLLDKKETAEPVGSRS